MRDCSGRGGVRGIRRILAEALRSSGELRLRRRLAAFLRRSGQVLDGDLAVRAQNLLRELSGEAERGCDGTPI